MKLKMALLSSVLLASSAMADKYVLDTEGSHSYVNFKISHLGYGFVSGRFNDFTGEFDYDSSTGEISAVNVKVTANSVDTNHGERDKHLRSGDFLDVEKFPEATFVSTGFADNTLTGDLTIHGVTQPVSVPMTKTGEGDDPWGGYRVGFVGNTEIALVDFGITQNIGPSSKTVQLELLLEGVKQ